MNIQRISANQQPNFSAQTRILAPEKLLSKEHQNVLMNIGRKVGNSSDIIDFSITNPRSSRKDASLSTYKIFKNIVIGKNKDAYHSVSTTEIPYKQNHKILNNEETLFKNLKNTFENLLYKKV